MLEGWEVIIHANKSPNRDERIKERLLEYFPFNFGINPYPDARIVIPRASGRRGGPPTPIEALAIRDAVVNLNGQIPQYRQPLDSRNNIRESAVSVRRTVVRRGKIGKAVAGILDIFSIPDGFRKNYSTDTSRLVQAIDNSGSQPISPYGSDQSVEQAATAVTQQLANLNISANKTALAELIGGRVIEVEELLHSGVLEKIESTPDAALVRAVNRVTRLTGIDLQNTGRQLAIEELTHEATTGRKVHHGLLEQGLGLAENFFAWVQDFTGIGIISDIVGDMFMGALYRTMKFPKVKIFGEKLSQPATNKTIALTAIAPGISAITGYEILEIAGRHDLREALKQKDPQAYKAIVDIAARGVLADYSTLNGMNRRHGQKPRW